METTRKWRILLGNRKIEGYKNKKPVELELQIKTVKIPDGEASRLNWKLEEIREYTAVSIMGEVWCSDYYSDCFECGQIRDTVSDLFPSDAVQRICKLWDQWHLNNLTAGTVEQTACIDVYEVANPKWHYDYSEACEILKDAGLYTIETSPISYTYGSKWLIREVPEAIVNELIELFESFPVGKGS